MPVAMILVGIESGLVQTRVQVRFTLSGNYVAGGDTVDLTALVGQAAGGVPVFCANNAPLSGTAQGSTGDDYNFIPGTLLNNGKLKINTASNTELAGGAYPARISGDASLYGEFIFNKLN
jgi:hypothetical protein